jgi:hypothetical protein
MSAKTEKKPAGAKGENSTADNGGNEAGAKAPNGGGKGNGSGAKGQDGGKPKAVAKTAKRLRPGELDGLVLSYMCKNEKDLPVTPGTVAKAIGRSSGAVGNCLERLAKAKKARLAKKAPRAYDLKGVKAR